MVVCFRSILEGGKLSGSGVQIDITWAMQVISKITNTSAFGGVEEDFIVTGAQGDSKPLEHLPIPAEYEWFPRAGLQTGVAELGDSVCGVVQRSGQWNTSRSHIPRCGLAAAALRADSRFV